MKKILIVAFSMILMFSVTLSFVIITFILNWKVGLIELGVIHFFSVCFGIYILFGKYRRFETKIRWSLFIITVPLFGILSYFFFGQTYKHNINTNYKYEDIFINEKTKNIFDSKDNSNYEIFKNAKKIHNEQIYNNQELEYLKNGNEFFLSLFKEINNAKKYILLNFYIIDEGILLDNLVHILLKKMKENVKVYLIYDFVGSFLKTHKSIKLLKEAGAKIRVYSKINFPWIEWSTNYRNHRKDISIDGKVGYIGGINISDEYINLNKKYGLWNDQHLKIIGNSVQSIERIFLSDWKYLNSKTKLKEYLLENSYYVKNKFESNDKNLVQIISNGPNHKISKHLNIFIDLIKNSKKEIVISNAYFIPPKELIDELINALKRNVKVKILLPGISDKMFILDESKYWTKKIYTHGAEIYTIHNTFNHNKIYLFDDEISFLGSTNFDFRAFFSDQQTMTLVLSKEVNKIIKDDLIKLEKNSFKYKKTPNNETNSIKKFFAKIIKIIKPIL